VTRTAALVGVVAALAAACGPRRPSQPPPPAPPGVAVPVPGGGAVYYYRERPIRAYRDDDQGPFRVTTGSAADPDLPALLTRVAGAERWPREVGGDYVYWMTPERSRTVAAMTGVDKVEPLQPEDRIAGGLAAGTGPVEVIIDLYPPSPPRQQVIARLLAGWGGEPRPSSPGTLRVIIDHSRLLDVAGISDVRWIEPAGP